MSSAAVKAGGVFVEIGADPTKFFAALKGVNKNIGSIGKAMTSAGTKMAALGAGVVGPIFASAAAFANVGSALFDMSKRTGVATESLSVLQFAAEQTGTDMGGVEIAVKKMQKAIFAAGSGSKEAAEALAMVGLSAGDLEGLSADQQMGKIADGLMAIEDPGARAAIAMKLFGKSGTAVLPMLEGGSAGMAAFADEAKRLGLIMDSETAAKADSLGDAIDAVKSSMRMAFIQVGSAVAPILTQLAQGLAIVAANVGKFISENQAFVVSVLKGGAALVVVGGGVTVLGRSITLASTSFGTLGKAASLAVSPLTMLIGSASGVAKSFSLVAMPATLKLANTVGSSMLAASGSVTSFAATAGSAMAAFATSSATALAGFAASSAAGFVRMSGAASASAQAMFPVFFTGFNRGIAAGAGFFSATLRGLNGVVMASSALRSAMFAVSGSGMARFVSDIVGGLTLTYKSFVWWATGASARMAQYAANLTGAVGKTIASTAAMSAAWLGTAARGVATFVGSAVAGIGTYLGAAAMAVAGSVASAAAVAAAWLAPLAPLLLLSAAAVGVGVAVKQFGPQIAGAFSGLAGYVTEAGGAIAGGFSTAVSDGIAVLGDLATTATTTFNGIYESVAAGDLSGAMDVLWAGLLAGWLRGVEALMSYVDPMTSMMQNTFTYLSATVLEIWDGMLNRMAAGWDVMESNVRKGWNFLNAAFQGADQTALNDVAIDKEMRQRASARGKAVPLDYAGAADSVAAGREAANGQRAADRRAATVAAERALSSMVSGKSATRAKNSQADDLLASIKGATSVDQLAGVGGLGDQFTTMRDLGRLTSEQETMLSDALDKAAEGLTATATGGAKGAGDQSATSKAEVAGTFSSVNLGGMGFGSSLAERTAKAAEETAKNTRNLSGDGRVAA